MKSILKIAALLVVLQLSACNGDDEKSKSDVTLDMLTATSWSHAEVTHSDGDLSDQYTDFTIVFTKNSSDGFDGTFVVSHGGYAFTESAGKWRFNNDMDQIILDSDKEIEFEVEENHLRLEFTVAPSGGKVAGVSGHFVFDLQPL